MLRACIEIQLLHIAYGLVAAALGAEGCEFESSMGCAVLVAA